MEPLKPEERGWAGMAAAMIDAESEAAAGRPFVPDAQMRAFADRLAESGRTRRSTPASRSSTSG